MPEKLKLDSEAAKSEVEATVETIESAKPKQKPVETFATDFFKAAGISHCSKCGEKRRTNESGVFCPQSQPDCPML